jgi:uncharacterized protein YecE (DUF72 family)
MLYLGTSGYSYDDWVGPFYPAGLAKNKFFSYYIQHFGATELNFTYHRMPSARTLEAIARQAPPGFRFAVKATGSLTHDIEPGFEELFTEFAQAMRPLLEGGTFGCVLAQFPPRFRPSDEARAYVARFRERLQGLPTVIEFRHREWITDQTFELLEANELGYCCVDEPRFRDTIPPIARATADIAYVRFHGRNYDRWWHHDYPWQRYDYTYSVEELQEWVPKIASLAERAQTVYVFANNHYKGQAVDTATRLGELLEAADVGQLTGPRR